MTAWTTLTSGDLDPGSPVTATVAGAWYYNVAAFAEKASGAPQLAAGYVTQTMMGAASVGQSQLKTASSSQSANNGRWIATLAGGYYNFAPLTKYVSTTAGPHYHMKAFGAWYPNAVPTAATNILPHQVTGAGTVGPLAYVTLWASLYITEYAENYYVQACPPYDHGDGLVSHYVFAVVNKDGTIGAVSSAEDAPWHNNGPTKAHADYYDAQGRGWRWDDVLEDVEEPEDLTDYATAAINAGWMSTEPVFSVDLEKYCRFVDANGNMSACQSWKELCSEQSIKVKEVLGKTVRRKRPTGKRVQTEITQQIKQADMSILPHPFTMSELTSDQTVVLLDPVNDYSHRMLERVKHEDFDMNGALHRGDIKIGNTGLKRKGPKGVMVVPFSLK